jgi:hypothetical protein
LVLDGAPNHRSSDLVFPGNISLLFLPPYAPELNPKENLWDEIREKIFKNYALKSCAPSIQPRQLTFSCRMADMQHFVSDLHPADSLKQIFHVEGNPPSIQSNIIPL